MIGTLPGLARCFQGIIPGSLATCALGGTPNATDLSQIRQVDDRRVAISRQLFDKTRRNLEEDPRATTTVLDPITFEEWKLGLRDVRSETDTPLFVEMALWIEAIGSALAVAALSRRPGRGRTLAWGLTAVLAVDLTVRARLAAATIPSKVFAVEPRLAAYLRSLAPDPLGVPYGYWSLGCLTPVHTIPGERLASVLAESDQLDNGMMLEPWGRFLNLPSVLAESDQLNNGMMLEPWGRFLNLPSVLAESDQLNNGRGLRFGLDAVQGAGPALRRTEQPLSTRSLRVAQLGGAARIVLRDPPLLPGVDGAAPKLPQAHLLRVDDPLPRALLVPRGVVVPRSALLPALLNVGFDPRETVLLEEGPGLEAPGTLARRGIVKVLRRRPGRLALETRADHPAVLTIQQAWEAGWTATVDGRNAPVARADLAFQAIRLDKGRHVVELEFRPRGLREGGLLALAGLLGLVLAVRRRPVVGALHHDAAPIADR